MDNRAVLHEQFVTRFDTGRRRKPITVPQLDSTEEALGMLWPSAYRAFASAYGAVYTPGLLDLVVEQKPGFSDVQEFFKPTEVVWTTLNWRKLGLADACCAFATDCMGNHFVFRSLPPNNLRPDDATVWLFDHEYEKVEVEASSFDEWLSRYLTL